MSTKSIADISNSFSTRISPIISTLKFPDWVVEEMKGEIEDEFLLDIETNLIQKPKIEKKKKNFFEIFEADISETTSVESSSDVEPSVYELELEEQSCEKKANFLCRASTRSHQTQSENRSRTSECSLELNLQVLEIFEILNFHLKKLTIKIEEEIEQDLKDKIQILLSHKEKMTKGFLNETLSDARTEEIRSVYNASASIFVKILDLQ